MDLPRFVTTATTATQGDGVDDTRRGFASLLSRGAASGVPAATPTAPVHVGCEDDGKAVFNCVYHGNVAATRERATLRSGSPTTGNGLESITQSLLKTPAQQLGVGVPPERASLFEVRHAACVVPFFNLHVCLCQCAAYEVATNQGTPLHSSREMRKLLQQVPTHVSKLLGAVKKEKKQSVESL